MVITCCPRARKSRDPIKNFNIDHAPISKVPSLFPTAKLALLFFCFKVFHLGPRTCSAKCVFFIIYIFLTSWVLKWKNALKIKKNIKKQYLFFVNCDFLCLRTLLVQEVLTLFWINWKEGNSLKNYPILENEMVFNIWNINLNCMYYEG